MIRTYSELSRISTFGDRYNYLRLRSSVGKETFGFDRYLNQSFYKTREWLAIRNFVIARDNGCDLGVEGYDIMDRIYIHHMNPVMLNDLIHKNEDLLDPKYLISTTLSTHNAIHFGATCPAATVLTERTKNDTCPWKS